MKAWGARLRNPVALAIVLPALVLGALGWYVRWTADDAFIHFRVVDQLMHGNGPVFNAGERVEASTSIAWVLILVVARVVTFGLVRVEYLALVLSLVATVGGLTMAGHAAAKPS